MLVEACVDSVEGAVAAQAGGAARVELCTALLEGGLTPSAGAIALARRRLRIGLHVIVRPRGGDFLYTETEHEVMLEDINAAKQLGADGVVIGVLDPRGNVDRDRTRALVERARPMAVTFHRAFDMAREPFEALESLVELGVDRLLTSGQEESAMAGLDLLRQLIEEAGERIIVMPAGSIHERNIEKIARETRASELHITGFVDIESGMQFRNPRVHMGGLLRPPEYSRATTDAERIRTLVSLARGLK
ncbi:MAG TPA: copper homeostasis protein CutC [Vicinamibacteria bacterium]|nr:copper homeostasis protein CutC [Vicinamibacteria bacterium]